MSDTYVAGANTWRTKWSPTLTEDEFNNLLAWLDKDRDCAGQKYERIRRELIRFFARRGCPIAEELGDETINRVAGKVPEIAPGYVGDPCWCFLGFARNVFNEYLKYLKKQGNTLPMPPPDPPDEKERRFACLDKCLNKLDTEDRELILEYYREDKRAKIERRKHLAERCGVTLNTLRMRVHRIKLVLERCINDCLGQSLVEDCHVLTENSYTFGRRIGFHHGAG